MTLLSRPLKILVVDDNEDNATSLSLLLKLQGNDVAVALDGLSAIKVAAKFRPDLILLDLGMPRMTGYAVCGSIRGTSEGQSIMIVAQTAWASESDRRSVKDAGFDRHLQKPIDPQLLEEVLFEARFRASKTHPTQLASFKNAGNKDLP